MAQRSFLADFFLPLVAGATVRVGAPLGAVGLRKLVDEKPPIELDAAIADARMSFARTLLFNPILPRLDVAALRLGVALHDLLFLLHPAASGAMVRDKRVKQVAEHAAEAARLPPTVDADDLVARHSVLRAFPGMGRTDVRVSFWAGRQEFHGEEPPARLLAWPKIRKVRQERWRASCFVEAAAHPLGNPVVRALLDGSPLTDLLHPVRIEPKLSLARMADVLVEPESCRLVAYAYLGEGLDRVGGALAQATLVELDGRDPRRARFVLAFVAHLHICTALGDTHRGDAPGTLRAAGLGAASEPALRDFVGLYPAIRRAAPTLSAPFDVRRSADLLATLDAHAAACETICGVKRTDELTALVARAIAGAPALLERSESPSPTPEAPP